MTDQLTPEEIQQARELAIEVGDALGPDPAFLARAVLALTEQQPEPATRDEIVDMFEAEFADDPTYAVVEHLLSRYTITRKPEGADHD